jgi:hypothetical protein
MHTLKRMRDNIQVWSKAYPPLRNFASKIWLLTLKQKFVNKLQILKAAIIQEQSKNGQEQQAKHTRSNKHWN